MHVSAGQLLSVPRWAMAALAISQRRPPPTASQHGRMEKNRKGRRGEVYANARTLTMGDVWRQYVEGRGGHRLISPVPTLPMSFGWVERRVVHGPQGPPCSSAPDRTYSFLQCLSLEETLLLWHIWGGNMLGGGGIEAGETNGYVCASSFCYL